MDFGQHVKVSLNGLLEVIIHVKAGRGNGEGSHKRLILSRKDFGRSTMLLATQTS